MSYADSMFSPTSPRFLVTGAGGQDGLYMVEKLLLMGIEVHGLFHTESSAQKASMRFPLLRSGVMDLADSVGMIASMESIEPTHVVNLAGNTSVEWSWTYPSESADVLGVGPVRLLEASWKLQERLGRPVRFLQASSAEIFGNAADSPQSETTQRKPVTPYGAAKSFADMMVGVYRDRGLFASSAILYNHESPRRPLSFVARKISHGAAKISLGLSEKLVLGNIDVFRDWGFAPDYVDAMLRIVMADAPRDYIVASGAAHSVRNFVQRAFASVGIDNWKQFVEIDRSLYRPADPRELVGDPSRLRQLGWSPTLAFEELVELMVQSDLSLLNDQTVTSR